MGTTAKGNAAELRVRHHMEAQDWLVASLRKAKGAGDHLAVHPRQRSRVIETKGCKDGTLWQNFTRADRVALLELAERYDADPLLAHSPSATKPIVWLTPDQWPT